MELAPNPRYSGGM